jgi:predicted RNase H-like HicB family nuclease
MTTLIAAYNSEGCIGRCDAKCYNATCPECDCICGGANHGVGRDKAIENTRELAEQWMEEYKHGHPEVEDFEVPAMGPVQLELFPISETARRIFHYD